MVSTPLAAVGIDRVVAIVWGICTERYTAVNSLESSRRHVGHFCPSLPGITPGLKDHRYSSTLSITPGLKGSPLLLSGEFVPSVTPLGTPLELRRNPPGIPLDTLPGITPGLEDHLRCRPPWNLWNSADSSSGSTSPLSGNTRPPRFYLPRAFSQEPYLYHPIFKVCVCVALKNSITPCVLVLDFREQFMPIGSVLSFSENS